MHISRLTQLSSAQRGCASHKKIQSSNFFKDKVTKSLKVKDTKMTSKERVENSSQVQVSKISIKEKEHSK